MCATISSLDIRPRPHNMATIIISTVFLIISLAFSSSPDKILVDPAYGNDTEECLRNRSVPCRTLNYAYYRKSLNDSDPVFSTTPDTSSVQNRSKNTEFLLKPGKYEVSQPLVISESDNLIFSAESENVTIRCPDLSNRTFGPDNYTFYDISVHNSSNCTFKGITFESCGPRNSALFAINIEGFNIINCTFR